MTQMRFAPNSKPKNQARHPAKSNRKKRIRLERRSEMDFETYKGSLAEEAPPEGLSMAAQALWWEAKGDWHLAHQC
jgi:hypothetical protein